MGGKDAGRRFSDQNGWKYPLLHLRRAEKGGHPNIKLPAQIARVISEDAPLSSLDEFSEWKEAVAATIAP